MATPIGIANSVSANFDFDPFDAIAYAKQGNFDSVQIYLNEALVVDAAKLKRIREELADFEHVYYHAEGHLNEEFLEGEYNERLFEYLAGCESPRLILHFDERANIDKLIKLIETLAKHPVKLYIENYFLSEGKEIAEKNLKKFLALFTLARNFGHDLSPVFDIPRVFHQNLGFEEAESLEWCYQILNFFGNRRIPILLHLVDVSSAEQSRVHFTTLGSGILPYEAIFNFMLKTRPGLEGIILEFEDKINPLKSREYLQEVLGSA